MGPLFGGMRTIRAIYNCDISQLLPYNPKKALHEVWLVKAKMCFGGPYVRRPQIQGFFFNKNLVNIEKKKEEIMHYYDTYNLKLDVLSNLLSCQTHYLY